VGEQPRTVSTLYRHDHTITIVYDSYTCYMTGKSSCLITILNICAGKRPIYNSNFAYLHLPLTSSGGSPCGPRKGSVHGFVHAHACVSARGARPQSAGARWRFGSSLSCCAIKLFIFLEATCYRCWRWRLFAGGNRLSLRRWRRVNWSAKETTRGEAMPHKTLGAHPAARELHRR
jgi:hypothetical protein